MGFITKEGLKELDNYHYKSGGYTKLDNLMNPFWEGCQKIVPNNVAPNTITFVGFLLMIASYLIMLYFDQTFTKVLPTWVYCVTALFQLIYQTMDAVDGKHARQTKSSSPLGQLFDHGCDSFSVSFLILSICQTVRLGPTTEVIFFFSLIQVGFFMASWAEYHTGILKTNYANFGVTEGEFMIAGAVLIGGLFPQFFDSTLTDIFAHFNITVPAHFLLQVQLKNLILKFLYGSISLMVVAFVGSTLISAERKGVAAAQFIPIFANIATTYLWHTLPVFQNHAGLVLLISGIIFSLNTSRIIICSLTKMDTPVFQLEYVVYFIGYLAVSGVFGPQFRGLEYNILVGLAIYATVSAVFWAKGCINQISSYLGIYCFSLQKRKAVKEE